MRRARTILRIGLALALSGACLGTGPRAQAPPEQPPGSRTADPCTAFAWSLLREQAWFEAHGLPRVASGATLSPDSPGAILALKPGAEAEFPVPPSREPGPGTFGGVLRFPAPTMPGLYQVTLSDEAWIDVSQDGKTTRPPIAHTGRSGCPGLRKSLRFQFGTNPVIIEVSGATGDTIKIAVAPVE